MQKILINKEQSYAIEFIRAISAIMIVVCHIFQGLNNELAFWFNVGVQVFLFMSGFLMARNPIESKKEFFIKRLSKIIISYYIFLILSLFLYSTLGVGIEIKSIIVYVLCLQGIVYKNIIPGLEHLWFISVILVCYVLTIFLNVCRDKIMNCNKVSLYLMAIGILILVQIAVNGSVVPIAFGARIGAFILGYFVSCRCRMVIKRSTVIKVCVFTVVTLIVRIYFTYFNKIDDFDINKVFNDYFVNWQHTLLGCFIFILFYYLISMHGNKNRVLTNIVRGISKYSYEIYLVHQPFILGPLSILFLTKSLSVNVVIITILICISSIIVYHSSNFIKKAFLK